MKHQDFKRKTAGLALLLLLAAIPALADVGDVMYTNKDGVKVYLEPDKDSEVIERLDKGFEVYVSDESDDGKWYGYYDQYQVTTGWIQKKYLSSEEPHEHEWGDWELTAAPTCEETGVETRVCKHDASHTQTRDVEAIGHDWDDGVVTKEPTLAAEGETIIEHAELIDRGYEQLENMLCALGADAERICQST